MSKKYKMVKAKLMANYVCNYISPKQSYNFIEIAFNTRSCDYYNYLFPEQVFDQANMDFSVFNLNKSPYLCLLLTNQV